MAENKIRVLVVDDHKVVRVGLAAMFLLTGVAHFNRLRADLIRMVQRQLPNPGALVTVTGVAELPAIRRLGLPPSLEGARLIARGSWVRAIIAVGPAHLHRVVERAAELLAAPQGGPS